jgi:2'-5' RNA ligase
MVGWQVEGGRDREFLGQMATTLQQAMASAGITALGAGERDEGFTPHVTVLKTSRDRGGAVAEANRCAAEHIIYFSLYIPGKE